MRRRTDKIIQIFQLIFCRRDGLAWSDNAQVFYLCVWTKRYSQFELDKIHGKINRGAKSHILSYMLVISVSLSHTDEHTHTHTHVSEH